MPPSFLLSPIHWSIHPSTHSQEGYKVRFGVVYVDFKTQERYLKDSAKFYSELINTFTINEQKLLGNDTATNSSSSMMSFLDGSTSTSTTAAPVAATMNVSFRSVVHQTQTNPYDFYHRQMLRK